MRTIQSIKGYTFIPFKWATSIKQNGEELALISHLNNRIIFTCKFPFSIKELADLGEAITEYLKISNLKDKK